jgi:hypothetical protein
MNDLMRDKFMDKNGNLPIYGEVIAGGCVSGNLIFQGTLEIKLFLKLIGRWLSSYLHQPTRDRENPTAGGW